MWPMAMNQSSTYLAVNLTGEPIDQQILSISTTLPLQPPREFVLKMWRNGFSIDDGDLRPYNDPGMLAKGCFVDLFRRSYAPQVSRVVSNRFH